MKNFDFITKLAEVIPSFSQLHAYCDKAEIQSTIADLETLLASRMQYWFD